LRRLIDVALVLLVILGAVLAACGRKGDGGSSTGVPTTVSPEAANARFPANQIVWQTGQTGGVVTQVAWAARRPAITIYGDGRVYVVQPAHDPRYDQPIPLRTGTVAPRDLATFIARAEAGGLLDEDADYGTPDTADRPTTVITMQGLGEPRHLEVYALGGRYDVDVTEEQAARREALRILLHEAEALVPEPENVTPERVRVLQLPDRASYEETPDDNDPDDVPDWPGPAATKLTGAPPPSIGRATVLGCGEVTGEAAAELFDAAVDNPTPRWLVEGELRTFVVVALLPGEAACG